MPAIVRETVMILRRVARLRHLHACVCGLLVAIASAAAAAQDVVATPAAQAPATDPLLVAPPMSLSEAQIRAMQARLRDWPDLARYRDDNARLSAEPATRGRVVFFGDSITDAWGRAPGTTFFPGKPYVNRGISGQTTAQMLVRFRQDVVDLAPAAVLILAGTNDIAGNTGEASQAMIEDNLRAMAELARANRIHVVFASVLPAKAYPWRPGVAPAARLRALNHWLRRYAKETGAGYADYYDALCDDDGGMRAAYTDDGVHPNAAGYAVMAPIAQAAIDASFAR